MESAKKILLVDDDADFRVINRMVLEASGYEIDEADSVAAALAKISEIPFDLLIVDLMMEDRDSGFQIAYSVRNDEKTRHLPILMLTSAQEKTGFNFEFSQDQEWMKVDDFAAKPLKPAELVAKVEKLIGRERA